jgi:sulfane dehydrogenase subunit SoxC
VWLEAPDSGTFAGVTSDHYVKDLPLEHALRDDVLLAWAMNGTPLTIEHGFPLRAFVPGFFGTNAVKWLSRIHLADHRPESLFTTRLYNRRRTVNGQVISEPVRHLDVHAVIVSPAEGAQLARGAHEISGKAWSASDVARVEVSVDGGTTWRAAALDSRDRTPAWQRFVMPWTVEEPGRYELSCRATDRAGSMQPGVGRNRIHTIVVSVT